MDLDKKSLEIIEKSIKEFEFTAPYSDTLEMSNNGKLVNRIDAKEIDYLEHRGYQLIRIKNHDYFNTAHKIIIKPKYSYILIDNQLAKRYKIYQTFESLRIWSMILLIISSLILFILVDDSVKERWAYDSSKLEMLYQLEQNYSPFLYPVFLISLIGFFVSQKVIKRLAKSEPVKSINQKIRGYS
ncbi:hypothetical protein [Streptococcus sp. CSL10205-OR2]|uniref:hypothetical protein n=1 Tax=Streptococcus sp. CSL10205-OR2 TaxID=2980558 RepID=UPI0021D8283C|nr:hypothetical protein [Streptococcus sp. CSL10205-OR2]MCU9533686.1 hypothetical protein [Streptococcus sp. CSL10205-OR2]